jgi:hypothetical protein
VQLDRLDVPDPEIVSCAADAATLHGTQHRALVDAARRGSLGKGIGHGVHLAAIDEVRSVAAQS